MCLETKFQPVRLRNDRDIERATWASSYCTSTYEVRIPNLSKEKPFQPDTVTYTESGTPMLNWDSRYLCHFSTEMAEIWSPGTFFEDVWTHKISALYLLYFQSSESFCGVFSDLH